jgi:hypothetical protein
VQYKKPVASRLNPPTRQGWWRYDPQVYGWFRDSLNMIT